MKTYEFDVVLENVSELGDEQTEAIFAAGCDDCTPASSNGVAWLHFDREAISLEEAIRSALSQVRSTGLSISKIELDANSAISLGA
jgi:hypothetical protein